MLQRARSAPDLWAGEALVLWAGAGWLAAARFLNFKGTNPKTYHIAAVELFENLAYGAVEDEEDGQGCD
jgi:hypothetical protein